MVRGKPKIADAAMADAEWMSNTEQQAGHIASSPNASRAPINPVPAPRPDGQTDDDVYYSIGYNEARTRHEVERWRRARADREKAELELAIAKGQVVDAKGAQDAVVDAFSRVRTKLLGVPSRVRQAMPELPMEAVEIIDERIREALEELADGR